MKKHIPKIIALVGILILCFTFVAVPCFAHSYIPNGTGTTAPLPTVTASYYDSYYDDIYLLEDAIPSYEPEITGYVSDVFVKSMTIIHNVEYKFSQEFISTMTEDEVYPIINCTIPNTVITNEDRALLQDMLTIYLPVDTLDPLKYSIAYEYIPYYQGNKQSVNKVTIDMDFGGGSIQPHADAVRAIDEIYGTEWDYIVVSDIHISGITPSNYFGITVPYSGSQGVYWYSPLTIDEIYKNENIYIDEIPVGEFLWNSLDSFLNFEIFPGISLYLVFTSIVAIPIFIWFLKIFAGG